MTDLAAVCRRLKGGEGGAAVVEFALVAPLLVLMVLGLVDFGMAVLEKSRLSSAARAGAQVAMSSPTDTAAIRAAVLAATSAPSAGLTVAVTTACECSDGTAVACDGLCASGTARTYVTVSVQETFAMLLTYPGISSPYPLAAQAIVRTE